MSTSIAELFIELGIKGSDKTISAFTGVSGVLSKTKGMALETKLALAGIFYEIQNLTSQSTGLGKMLLNFSALTGEASKFAEQMGNAAKVGGGSFEETLQTLQKLQAVMMKAATSQEYPPVFRYLQQFGGLRREDFGDLQKVTDSIRTMIQALPNKGLGAALRNQITQQLPISDQMLALWERGIFNPKNVNRQPSTSKGGQDALAGVSSGFNSILLNWETLIKNLTIKHSGGMKELAEFSKSLINLIYALDKLASNSGVYGIIDSLVQFLTLLGNAATSTSVALNNKRTPEENKKYLLDMEKSTLERLRFYNQPLPANWVATHNTPEEKLILNQYFYGQTDAHDVKKAGYSAAHQVNKSVRNNKSKDQAH